MQSLSILMLELLCPLLVSCLVPGGSDGLSIIGFGFRMGSD